MHCQERGVRTDEGELELLHKKGWLNPIAFSGNEAGDPVIELTDYPRELWNSRTHVVPYESWLSFKDGQGMFVTPPWYSTAQIYPLMHIRNAFRIGFTLGEYETLLEGSDEDRSQVLSEIQAYLIDNVKMNLSNLSEWDKLFIFLTDLERYIDSYIDEANSKTANYDQRASSNTLDDYYDYVSGIQFISSENAKKCAKELALPKGKILNYYNILEAKFQETLGSLEPLLMLRYLPKSYIYQSTGPMKLGLDILRDMRQISVLAYACHGLKLFRVLTSCPECGNAIPKSIGCGRTRVTCGKPSCVRAHRAKDQARRRHNYPTSPKKPSSD